MEGENVRIVHDDPGDEPESSNPTHARRLAVATIVLVVVAVILLVPALRSTEEPPSNPPDAAPATATSAANAGGDLRPQGPGGRLLPWLNQTVDGEDPIVRCVEDAALLIDTAPQPEGLYTFHWTATSQNGFEAESEAQFWIADCERESNLVADADDITVQISTIDVSGLSNLIYLDRPTDVLIGVDGSGKSVTIEDVGNGTTLIFRIDVWACADGVWPDTSCTDTGNSYYSGPGSNNDDGQKYALHIPDGRATWVLFNDDAIDPDGADQPGEPNYIDAIFAVGPASP